MTKKVGLYDKTLESDSTYVDLANNDVAVNLLQFNTAEEVQKHVENQAKLDVAQLHKGHKGELSLAELEKKGITLEDIAKVLTPEDMVHFHAGPMGFDLAKIMKKVEAEMSGSGFCLAGVQIGNQRLFAKYKDKFTYSADQKHCKSNSACYAHQALVKEGYYVFRFDNKTGKNANPILGLLPAGAIVNFDKNPAAGTKHGHICVADEYVQKGTGHFYSDTEQEEAKIVSGIRGGSGTDVYGDTFYLSFLADTTISDELLQKILMVKNYEKYTENYDIKEVPVIESDFRPATEVERDDVINLNNAPVSEGTDVSATQENETAQEANQQLVRDEEKMKEKIAIWLGSLNIMQEDIDAFIQKFGLENAYKLALVAVMEPVYLDAIIGRSGKPSSRGTVQALMALDDETINKAIEYADRRFSEEENWYIPLMNGEKLTEAPKQESQTAEVVEQPVVGEKVETKTDMKVQYDKSEMKTESAVIYIKWENGVSDPLVKKDIIKNLMPIYGEYAEAVYMAALYPKFFDDALGIKRSKVSSKALLKDLLSFEGENVEKAIAYVKDNPIRDIQARVEKETPKKTTSSSKQSKSDDQQVKKTSSNKVYYTKGGYKCKMPYELAEKVMGVLKKKESDGSYHYIDANGVWTNVGSTYSNNKNEFETIFGKSTCNLINIAEEVVRNNNSDYVYYSLDGKNWTKARKGGGGKGDYVLKRIQAKTKGGDKVFISSKPGGKGNVVEYERISGKGFIIKKVKGQSIADPGWEVAENLNMQIMDKHYKWIKAEIHPDNWDKLTAKQKVDLMYAHYHNPKRAKEAVKSYGLKRKLPAYELDFETDTTTHTTKIRDVKVSVNKRGKGR